MKNIYIYKVCQEYFLLPLTTDCKQPTVFSGLHLNLLNQYRCHYNQYISSKNLVH